jgi:hypothetical protein
MFVGTKFISPANHNRIILKGFPPLSPSSIDDYLSGRPTGVATKNNGGRLNDLRQPRLFF